MEFKLVNVPDPKLNPAGPYSKFHAVSVPPAVHDKSAVLAVTFPVINPVGSTHAGGGEQLVLETTDNPIAKEDFPFTGQELSVTVIFIAVKGFVPGNTTIQKLAVTGEVEPVCENVEPGNNWVILEVIESVSFGLESINTISKHILSPSQACIPNPKDPGNVSAP